MKNRITEGWNLRRLLYGILGVITLIMAIKNRDWLVAGFGIFVALIRYSFIGFVPEVILVEYNNQLKCPIKILQITLNTKTLNRTTSYYG